MDNVIPGRFAKRVIPVEKASGYAARSISIPSLPKLAACSAEDEDAGLTGMTRSLHRRLTGLNFPRLYTRTAQRAA